MLKRFQNNKKQPKTQEKMSKSACRLLRFLFTEDSLEVKKDLRLVSRPYLLHNFSIKFFLLYYYINWSCFITRLCLLRKLFSRMNFLFDV